MNVRFGLPVLEKPMPRWLQVLDTVALCLLCVYVAENCIGSAGHWLEIGPLSIRIVLFILCFAATLPLVLYRIRDFVRNPTSWIVAAFFVWFGVSAVRGYLGGNDLTFLKQDITSMLPFTLYFGFAATVRDGKRLQQVMKTVFYASTAVAVLVFALHIAMAFMTSAQIGAVSAAMSHTFNNGLGTMKAGGQRIYLRSEVFMQVAMLIGWYELWNKPSRAKRVLIYISEAFLLMACILTYTRSLWIGLFVSVVLLFVFLYKEWKRWLCDLVALGALFAVLVGISCACYRAPMVPLSVLERVAPSLVTESVNHHSVDPQKEAEKTDKIYEQSADVREDTQEEQMRLIVERPLLGHGLGKGLSSRKHGKTEYTYQDTWMKMGLVGLLLTLVLWFAHCGVTAVRWCKCKKKDAITAESAAARGIFLLCCLVGLGATSYFNPFIASPMGATIWMMALVGMEFALREPQGALAYKEEEL